MKKTVFLSIIIFAFTSLKAQMIENNPCTATCVDPLSKILPRQPKQDGISPNQYRPCGDVTKTEDNPIWYVLRPIGNKITIGYETLNCSKGWCETGIEITLWQGDNCSNISPIACTIGTSGTLNAKVLPCKMYFLQIDGICESQCTFILKYDKKQLVIQDNFKADFKAPKSICLGGALKLNATIPNSPSCQDNTFGWKVEPSNAATISTINGEPNSALLKVNTMPASGKVKVCATPRFTGKCTSLFTPTCYEIEVTNSTNFEANISVNSPICQGEKATFSATQGASYLWTGPNNFTSTLANPFISNAMTKDAGQYKVEVTLSPTCKGVATTQLNVKSCKANDDSSSKGFKDFQVYPNPFTHQLNIDTKEKMEELIIYNTLGQIMLTTTNTDYNHTIDMSNLPLGYYLIQMKWENGNSSTHKVLKM